MKVRFSRESAPDGGDVVYYGAEPVGSLRVSGSGYGYARTRHYRFSGLDGYQTSDPRRDSLRVRIAAHYGSVSTPLPCAASISNPNET